MKETSVASSFRDPSGSLFFLDGAIYRRVNPSYKTEYDLLMSSGLYRELTGAGLLVSHEEVALDGEAGAGAYRLLKPELVPFISYPYEWSFSQLKDAALATLAIQKAALACGMSLKDASAYNVQFLRGKPVFIDTLSFAPYVEGYPWVAYRQFCQHFLAPLALMSHCDIRLNQLLRLHIDGVPIDLASSLLPFRTRLSFAMMLHIHMHAKSQQRHLDTVVDKSHVAPGFGRQAILGLVDSLTSLVSGLRWAPRGTEWVDYYQDDSYVPAALEFKNRLVACYLEQAGPKTVWDMGANTGMYSRIAAKQGARVVSFDIDPACVELNYAETRKNGETTLLPLLLDLTNPSPRIGWANEERLSVPDRGPVDLVMALALIHHLAISNNVPLARVAGYFAGMAPWLVIEFVPKSDHKVRKLLATREDVFPGYTREGFEAAFGTVYEIREARQIEQSERTLYLMQRK